MTLEEEKESFHLNCYNWSNDIFELKILHLIIFIWKIDKFNKKVKTLKRKKKIK